MPARPASPYANESMTLNFIRLSRIFWTLLLAAAGLAHFLIPDFFVAYYPRYLPWPEAAVLCTGIFEWVLAALLWVPAWQQRAWAAISLMLVCYLPLHIFIISDYDRIVHPFPEIPLWLAWVRLPLQILFIAWTLAMCIRRAENDSSR